MRDAGLRKKKRQGGRVTEGIRLPGARGDILSTEGSGDPPLARKQIVPLDSGGSQAGLRLGDASPGKSELAVPDQGFQVGAAFRMGIPEMPDEEDLFERVAEALLLFGQVDGGLDIVVGLLGIDGEGCVPIRIPMGERDQKDHTAGAGDQGLGWGVQVYGGIEG